MVGGVKDIITSHFKQTQTKIVENQENQKSYKNKMIKEIKDQILETFLSKKKIAANQ